MNGVNIVPNFGGDGAYLRGGILASNSLERGEDDVSGVGN